MEKVRHRPAKQSATKNNKSKDNHSLTQILLKALIEMQHDEMSKMKCPAKNAKKIIVAKYPKTAKFIKLLQEKPLVFNSPAVKEKSSNTVRFVLPDEADEIVEKAVQSLEAHDDNDDDDDDDDSFRYNDDYLRDDFELTDDDIKSLKNQYMSTKHLDTKYKLRKGESVVDNEVLVLTEDVFHRCRPSLQKRLQKWVRSVPESKFDQGVANDILNNDKLINDITLRYLEGMLQARVQLVKNDSSEEESYDEDDDVLDRHQFNSKLYKHLVQYCDKISRRVTPHSDYTTVGNHRDIKQKLTFLLSLVVWLIL